jgi:hypothetical protein
MQYFSSPQPDNDNGESQQNRQALMAERQESLKAGLVASGAVTLPVLLTILLSALGFDLERLVPLPSFTIDTLVSSRFAVLLPELISIGSIFISTFLFGVTYRYAAASSRNFQLKAGIVAAFGLVRGLALTEKAIATTPIAYCLIQVAASLGTFALAGLFLDWTIGLGKIRPVAPE